MTTTMNEGAGSMRLMFRVLLIGFSVGWWAGMGLRTSPSAASEPGWSPVMVASGPYRESIKAMPIESRPYRPLHLYGNTVRRIHYHGTPLPLVRSPNVPSQGKRP